MGERGSAYDSLSAGLGDVVGSAWSVHDSQCPVWGQTLNDWNFSDESQTILKCPNKECASGLVEGCSGWRLVSWQIGWRRAWQEGP